MSGGIEKKGKEDLGVGIGHTFKDGEEMGAGGAKSAQDLAAPPLHYAAIHTIRDIQSC